MSKHYIVDDLGTFIEFDEIGERSGGLKELKIPGDSRTYVFPASVLSKTKKEAYESALVRASEDLIRTKANFSRARMQHEKAQMKITDLELVLTNINQ